MKAEYYFECGAWERVCQAINDTEGMDAIESISLQCVGGAGAQEAAQAWETRLQAILGAPVARSALQAGPAACLLLRYPNGVIARIFADTQSQDAYYNFEVVTRQALYVWKPTSQPQARFEGQQMQTGVCAQLFSVDLGVL